MTKSKANLMQKSVSAKRKTRSITRNSEVSSGMNWRQVVDQADNDNSNTQEGEYFVIRFEPELSEEIINIGVCLISGDGEFYIKTIKDFTILNQIWAGFEEQTKQMIEAAKEVFTKDGYPNSPSYQISYSELRLTRFRGINECLDSLYKSFITHDPLIKRG